MARLRSPLEVVRRLAVSPPPPKPPARSPSRRKDLDPVVGPARPRLATNDGPACDARVWSTARLLSPLRWSDVIRSLDFASIATRMSPRMKSTSMPLARRQ